VFCVLLVPQTSDYPVILSLENHCSVEQQEVMARHLSSILGSALVTSPLGEGMPTDFPSPEVCVRSDLSDRCFCPAAMPVAHGGGVGLYSGPLQELKGKFLIKGKRLNKLEASYAPEAAESDDTDVTEEDDESNNEDEDEQKEEEKRKVGCSTASANNLFYRRSFSADLNFLPADA